MSLQLFPYGVTPADVRVDVEPGVGPVEEEALSRAELLGVAPVERWTVLGSNQKMAYATHGLFRFFGKFPPPIATSLMERFTTIGDTVWDPTCGSGTTGVEALLHARPCLLSDVNPLAALLARVKTTQLALEATLPAVERTERLSGQLRGSTELPSPVGLRNPDHWFLPETTASLAALRAACEQETDAGLRHFLLVVFASVVRRVSRATTQQGRLFLDATTAIEDALPLFLEKAKVAAERVALLPKVDPEEMVVWEQDARQPTVTERTQDASLVIVHPPYFNAYRYSSVNSLEMAWLGISRASLKGSEVREHFKVGKREKVTEYVADMAEVLASICVSTRDDAVIALMIGDTAIHSQHVPVVRMLLDATATLPIELEHLCLRMPRFSEASWVASQRRKGASLGSPMSDYVLLFRRSG